MHPERTSRGRAGASILPACAALVGAFLATAAAQAATHAVPPTVPLSAKPTASPNQPVPRTGDYSLLGQGSEIITAKCNEGGTVFVGTREGKTLMSEGRKPAPRANGLSPDRDAAVRAACKAVDVTR